MGVGLFSLVDTLGQLPRGEDALFPVDGLPALPPSGFGVGILILQYAVSYLPAFLGLWILRAAFSLLDALELGPYHPDQFSEGGEISAQDMAAYAGRLYFEKIPGETAERTPRDCSSSTGTGTSSGANSDSWRHSLSLTPYSAS